MSDRDHWPDNPNDPPPRRTVRWEEKSSGGCLKWLLILGGLGLLGMFVCCGGLAWVGWSFIPKVVESPADVSAVGQQVMQIDIPPDYVGEAGMTIDNWLLTMRFATFRHKDGHGMLLIGAMHVKIGDFRKQRADFKARSLERTRDERKLTITKSEEREFTIRGEKVSFDFSEAREEQTDKKFRLVNGEIEGSSGMTIFQLTLNEEAYNEEAVVKMIESIR